MVVAPFVCTWPLINKKNKKGLLCRLSQKKKKKRAKLSLKELVLSLSFSLSFAAEYLSPGAPWRPLARGVPVGGRLRRRAFCEGEPARRMRM